MASRDPPWWDELRRDGDATLEQRMQNLCAALAITLREAGISLAHSQRLLHRFNSGVRVKELPGELSDDSEHECVDEARPDQKAVVSVNTSQNIPSRTV